MLHFRGYSSHLIELSEELERVRAKQRFLGKLLVEPNKPGRPKPFTCKKFLLQGVATSHDTVYVCRRAKADLIDFSQESESQPQDQWWRLSYDPESDELPVKVDVRF